MCGKDDSHSIHPDFSTLTSPRRQASGSVIARAQTKKDAALNCKTKRFITEDEEMLLCVPPPMTNAIHGDYATDGDYAS